MPQSTKLLFVSGSARADSLNKKLARLAAAIATADGIPATFADLGDYPMPLYDGDLEVKDGPPENAKKLEALMQVHAGIFIAAPEYNAGITPLLKNTLDWISRVRAGGEAPLWVFKTRVFALGAASTGGFGGVRGLIMVRQTLQLGLGALVLPEQISLPHARDTFDDDGNLRDKSRQETLQSVIRKLAKAAHILYS